MLERAANKTRCIMKACLVMMNSLINVICFRARRRRAREGRKQDKVHYEGMSSDDELIESHIQRYTTEKGKNVTRFLNFIHTCQLFLFWRNSSSFRSKKENDFIMCSCFCSNLCIVMYRKFRNVPLFRFFFSHLFLFLKFES